LCAKILVFFQRSNIII